MPYIRLQNVFLGAQKEGDPKRARQTVEVICIDTDDEASEVEAPTEVQKHPAEVEQQNSDKNEGY